MPPCLGSSARGAASEPTSPTTRRWHSRSKPNTPRALGRTESSTYAKRSNLVRLTPNQVRLDEKLSNLVQRANQVSFPETLLTG
jgi:hypothetical protein